LIFPKERVRLSFLKENMQIFPE